MPVSKDGATERRTRKQQSAPKGETCEEDTGGTAKESEQPDMQTTYRFHAEDDGDERTKDFRLVFEPREIDGNTVQVPKKLGDGNFGMVFLVRTVAPEGDAALKVLYRHRASAPDAPDTELTRAQQERVHEELTIGVKLKNELAHVADHPDLNKYDRSFSTRAKKPENILVLPDVCKKDFDDFHGRDSLEKTGVKFSGFAYIMEKFDKTLKDLVEGDPDESEEDGSYRTGYARLQKAKLEERERSATPILKQVAYGLQTLHAATYRHQDIKPANIYYRKDEEARVQFRLGDLGFLSPHDPVMAGSTAATIDAIGIGTKHYRSIEQIDFCDTAECDVEVHDEGKRATLTTRDPKFLETNMQKGDLAYLAKSSDRVLMRIVEDIHKDRDGRLVKLTVELAEPGVDQKTGEAKTKLHDDRNTQVSFVKNPSAKTDLFGLASILFDIVTVGDSPERFYELLRRYDVVDTNIGSKLLERYETWKTGILEDADISAIFNRVNRGDSRSETLHPSVLSFLLRAMMSNAKGSFYEDFGFAEAEGTSARCKEERLQSRLNAVGAWAKVIEQIRKVEEAIGTSDGNRNYDEVETNLLTRSSDLDDSGENTGILSDEHQVKLSRILACYRKGEPPVTGKSDGKGTPSEKQRMAFRWLSTIRLIERMTVQLSESFKEEEGRMHSLAQEHLSVQKSGVVLPPEISTAREDKIAASLRARDPLLTRIRPFSHRFEPIWWRYGTRRIHLRFLPKVEALDLQTDRNGTDADSSIEIIAEASTTISEADSELSKPDEGKAAINEQVGREKDVAAGASEVPMNDGKSASTDDTFVSLLSAEVEYADFAFAAQSIQEGDFILPSDGAASVVLRITGVEADRVSLKLCRNDARSGILPEEQLKEAQQITTGYLIKKPDPSDYSAGMLSVYLYHFLVSSGAGQDQQINDFPQEAYSNIRHFPLMFPKKPSDIGTISEWNDVKRHTIRLAIWLSLGGFCYASDGKLVSNDKEKWQIASVEIYRWCRDTVEFLGADDVIRAWGLLREPGLPSDTIVDKLRDGVSPDEWSEISAEYVRTARPLKIAGAESKDASRVKDSERWSILDRIRDKFGT